MSNSDYGHLPLGDNEEPPKKKRLGGWGPLIVVMVLLVFATIAFAYGTGRFAKEANVPIPTSTK